MAGFASLRFFVRINRARSPSDIGWLGAAELSAGALAVGAAEAFFAFAEEDGDAVEESAEALFCAAAPPEIISASVPAAIAVRPARIERRIKGHLQDVPIFPPA
jgi:hypothetical protein